MLIIWRLTLSGDSMVRNAINSQLAENSTQLELSDEYSGTRDF